MEEQNAMGTFDICISFGGTLSQFVFDSLNNPSEGSESIRK